MGVHRFTDLEESFKEPQMCWLDLGWLSRAAESLAPSPLTFQSCSESHPVQHPALSCATDCFRLALFA